MLCLNYVGMCNFFSGRCFVCVVSCLCVLLYSMSVCYIIILCKVVRYVCVYDIICVCCLSVVL